MPTYNLTPEEKALLNQDNTDDDGGMSEAYHSSSDSQLYKSNMKDLGRRSSARTMETLTNEIVSNIMGEVKMLNLEKTMSKSTKISSKESERRKSHDNNCSLERNRLQAKLLAIEMDCLQTATLQFAALKTLNVLLTSSGYSEIFLFSDTFRGKTDDNGTDETTRIDGIKWIMEHVVQTSMQQCKLRNIAAASEYERALSILHLNHARNRLEDFVDFFEEKERPDRLLEPLGQQKSNNPPPSLCNTYDCEHDMVSTGPLFRSCSTNQPSLFREHEESETLPRGTVSFFYFWVVNCTG